MKHFHGRRHIRARKIVQDARIKHQEKKIERFISYLEKIDWSKIAETISVALVQAAYDLARFAMFASAIGTAAASGASALQGARVTDNIKGNQ